jgi:hypothetical protein
MLDVVVHGVSDKSSEIVAKAEPGLDLLEPGLICDTALSFHTDGVSIACTSGSDGVLGIILSDTSWFCANEGIGVIGVKVISGCVLKNSDEVILLEEPTLIFTVFAPLLLGRRAVEEVFLPLDAGLGTVCIEWLIFGRIF